MLYAPAAESGNIHDISSPTFIVGLFYCPKFGKGLLMCDLSNAEVFNRWKQCKKQTAKDYWYDFLKRRSDRNYPGAKDYVNRMNFFK